MPLSVLYVYRWQMSSFYLTVDETLNTASTARCGSSEFRKYNCAGVNEKQWRESQPTWRRAAGKLARQTTRGSDQPSSDCLGTPGPHHRRSHLRAHHRTSSLRHRSSSSSCCSPARALQQGYNYVTLAGSQRPRRRRVCRCARSGITHTEHVHCLQLQPLHTDARYTACLTACWHAFCWRKIT